MNKKKCELMISGIFYQVRHVNISFSCNWNSDIRMKQGTMVFKKIFGQLGHEFSVKDASVYLA